MKDTLHEGAHSDTFEVLARLGWVVKGVLFGTIGLLALLGVLGDGNGETTDPRGAMGALGSGPLAGVLMGVAVLGLVAYALWRYAQAVFDFEDDGDDLAGLARRAAYAGIGVAYTVLAFTVASALLTDGRGPEGEADYTGWTALALGLPFGPWLVGAGGGFFIGAGLVQVYRAYAAPFLEHWQRNSDHTLVHRWGAWVSRFGLAARALVFGVIGWFLLRAAFDEDAAEARNVGEALSELSPEPWLLGLVAAGFIAFGVHCFLNAAYHHMNGDDAPNGDE